MMTSFCTENVIQTFMNDLLLCVPLPLIMSVVTYLENLKPYLFLLLRSSKYIFLYENGNKFGINNDIKW